MILRNYRNMNNLDYHKKQLEYNMSGLLNEIKKNYPNDINIQLDNPKYKKIIENSAFNPQAIGGLANLLQIENKVISIDLWEDLQNGWCPVEPGSPLDNHAIDTPKGRMIQFNKSATPMDELGHYDIKSVAKNRRAGTEFLFVFGERVSTAMALMATENPDIERQFKEMCMETFREEIMPEMLKLGRVRKGADGQQMEYAKNILAVPFLHSENRAEQPFYHFHFDLLNVAQGYDDKFYALETTEIGANASALDAIFMSSMKKKLEQKFGFIFKEVYHDDDLKNEFIKNHEKKIVSFDLPETVIPENIREYRSKREKELLSELKKTGKSGYAAEELARVESREEKTDLSPSELRTLWKENFQRMNWSIDDFQKDLSAYKKIQELDKTKNEKMKNFPTSEIIENSFLRNHKEVFFTEYQYLAHIKKQLLPYIDGIEAEKLATNIFENECVMVLDKGQMEYFKPFLEEKIEDQNERQSYQIRFHREVRFVHKRVLEAEKETIDGFKARREEEKFIFDKNEVDKFIVNFEAKKTKEFGKTFKFSNENNGGQLKALQMILTEKGAVCNISGRAGTGKSTLLEAAKEYLEKNGFNVIGTSTSSAATKELAKSTSMEEGQSLNTTHLLRLLSSGKKKLTNKDVIFWDEAGMAESKDFYSLSKYINEAGSKLVLIGEKEQLQAVGAGGLYSVFTENFITTKIKSINRQVDQWQREMVEDFACGIDESGVHRTRKGIYSLYDHGRVVIKKNEKERLQQVVNDYIDSVDSTEYITVTTGNKIIHYIDEYGQSYEKTIKEIDNLEGEKLLLALKNETIENKKLEEILGVKQPKIINIIEEKKEIQKPIGFKEKFIIAPENNDCEKINEKVREELKIKGLLPKEEVIIKGKDGLERNFSIGDRIIFFKNSKSADLETKKLDNSSTGTVLEIKNSRLSGKPDRVILLMDNGEKATVKIKEEQAMKHAYAITVHKSQGATKVNTFYYVSASVNSLHHAYVGASRHKKEFKMYLSNDMVEKMIDKMEDKEPTASMKKVAGWIANEKKLIVSPETLKSFNETRKFLNENWRKIDGKDPHPLDDFSNIVESMARKNFKKTTYDFDIIEGNGQSTYMSIKAKRIEQIRKDLSTPIEPPKAIQAKIVRANESQTVQNIKSIKNNKKDVFESIEAKITKNNKNINKVNIIK